MRNYNNQSNNRSGGGSSGGFGGGGRSGGRDQRRPEMHRATCTDCGNSCEVPFKPTSSKPVYCNHCFKREDNFNDNRGGGGRGFRSRDRIGNGDRGRDRDRQMHAVTCSNCGNRCEVPFKPTSSKPVYCDNCFASSKSGGNSNTDQFEEKFAELNKKLDKVIKILEIIKPKKTHIIEKPEPIEDSIDDPVGDPIKEKPVKKKAPAKKATKKATKKTK